MNTHTHTELETQLDDERTHLTLFVRIVHVHAYTHTFTQAQELETQLEDERTHNVALRGEIAEAESKAGVAVGLVANERAKLAAELETAELKVCMCLFV